MPLTLVCRFFRCNKKREQSVFLRQTASDKLSKNTVYDLMVVSLCAFVMRLLFIDQHLVAFQAKHALLGL